MLKEAHALLNPSAKKALTPHQIEHEFLSDRVFSERVLTANGTARSGAIWRNPSTHDHTLRRPGFKTDVVQSTGEAFGTDFRIPPVIVAAA